MARRPGRGRSIAVSPEQVPGLVRRIRAARRLTQEDLARELGVTFSTVNGWENGRHHPIPALARRLLEMASAAGIELPARPAAIRRSGSHRANG